ncbi:Uncharacterised protein [Enterobacter cloacae]|nr:Uncharacterised protein [Enterobacter cloacae]
MLLQLRMGKLHGMLRQRKEQIAFLQETHLVSERRQLATGGEFNQRKTPGHLPQCAQTAH